VKDREMRIREQIMRSHNIEPLKTVISSQSPKRNVQLKQKQPFSLRFDERDDDRSNDTPDQEVNLLISSLGEQRTSKQ
jgi:hypothetical protein